MHFKDQINLDSSEMMIPLRIRKDFLAKRRWSDELLPIGRLAKRGAVVRQSSAEGVFEREIRMGRKFEIPW